MDLATRALAQGPVSQHLGETLLAASSTHPFPPVQGTLTIWSGVVVPVPGLHDEGERTLQTEDSWSGV